MVQIHQEMTLLRVIDDWLCLSKCLHFLPCRIFFFKSISLNHFLLIKQTAKLGLFPAQISNLITPCPVLKEVREHCVCCVVGEDVDDQSRPVCGRRRWWHVLLLCQNLRTGPPHGGWLVTLETVAHFSTCLYLYSFCLCYTVEWMKFIWFISYQSRFII